MILSDYSTIGHAANKQSVLQLNQLLFKVGIISFHFNTQHSIYCIYSFLLLSSKLLFLNPKLQALTQLIISAESSQLLTKKHISLLLSYVEADILDADRQATAFSLIKAIVKKNIKHSKVGNQSYESFLFIISLTLYIS